MRFIKYCLLVLLTATPVQAQDAFFKTMNLGNSCTGSAGVGVPNAGTFVSITASSVATASIITATAHGFATGQIVTISGDTTATPTINGTYTVTVIDANNFSIPLAVTVAGTNGSVIWNGITGNICDWYGRSDGGASTVYYVKESGNRTTSGWVAYGASGGGGGGASLSTANTWTALQTFSSGLSGALTGNASTATALATPRNINGVAFDGSAAITVPAAASTLTGTLAAASFPALTGNVTTTAGSLATTIPAATITNAMLGGSIVASKLVGSDISTVGTLTAGSTGAGFTVAFGTSTLTGTIPTARLGSGTASSSTFLRGDQTWATPAGSGTVTASAGSLTAGYVVIGAGGTDTRPVAGQGVAGYVLTSNGTSDPTFQAATGGAAAAGTLTGATLASNVLASSLTSLGTLSSLAVTGTSTFTGQYYSPLINDGNSGSALTIDLSAGNDHYVTVTGNVTLTVINPQNGGRGVILLYSGTGGFTVTWPSTFAWAGGTAPIFTTTAGKTDLCTFEYVASVTKYFAACNQNY